MAAAVVVVLAAVSCSKDDDKSFNESYLDGTWYGPTNTPQYYQFNTSAHRGKKWQPNQDVPEADAWPFSWNLSGQTLTIYLDDLTPPEASRYMQSAKTFSYTRANGSISRDTYTVVDLSPSTLILRETGGKQLTYNKQ